MHRGKHKLEVCGLGYPGQKTEDPICRRKKKKNITQVIAA
jgi:hypothetical protein